MASYYGGFLGSAFLFLYKILYPHWHRTGSEGPNWTSFPHSILELIVTAANVNHSGLFLNVHKLY